MNFIGALLVKLHQERFSDIYRSEHCPLIGPIAKPFEIYNNVPLFIEKQEGLLLSELNATRILRKNLCGRDIAVVLEGDIPGIFLNSIPGLNPNEGMTISRLWNNELITYQTTGPYQSITTNGHFGDIYLGDKFSNEMTEIFGQYRDYEWRTIDLFAHLATLNGINIDNKDFVYTSLANNQTTS